MKKTQGRRGGGDEEEEVGVVEEEEAPSLPLIPAAVAGQKKSVDGKTRAKSLHECMCV